MRSGGKQIDFAQDKRRSCPCECSFKHAHGPCKDECGDVWLLARWNDRITGWNALFLAFVVLIWFLHKHGQIAGAVGITRIWIVHFDTFCRLKFTGYDQVTYWNKTSQHTACSCFERAPGDGTFGGESVFRCCAWVLTSIKDAWNCHWRFPLDAYSRNLSPNQGRYFQWDSQKFIEIPANGNNWVPSNLYIKYNDNEECCASLGQDKKMKSNEEIQKRFWILPIQNHEQLPGRSKKFIFGFLPSLAKSQGFLCFLEESILVKF